MNAEEFILGITKTVHEAAIENLKHELQQGPAGRKPSQRVVDLSEWYRGLTPTDRQRAESLIALSVHAAVFGVLAVLDGVRSIEPQGAKTDFQLLGERSGETAVINPSGTLLHDIYQAEVWEGVFGVEMAVPPN